VIIGLRHNLIVHNPVQVIKMGAYSWQLFQETKTVWYFGNENSFHGL